MQAFGMQLPVTSRLAKTRQTDYIDVNVNVIIMSWELAYV